MIDYVESGVRIRTRRKELGLTQETVAEKIGITPSFYSQIESGARRASINTFVSISQELSVSLDYLLCNGVLNPIPENFDDVEKMIFHRMKNFTVLEKECVLEVVTALDKIF